MEERLLHKEIRYKKTLESVNLKLLLMAYIQKLPAPLR